VTTEHQTIETHQLRPIASAALRCIALIGFAMLLILDLLPAALVAART
jgi:hypothetical protein